VADPTLGKNGIGLSYHREEGLPLSREEGLVTEVVAVLVTVPDAGKAAEMTRTLVEARLAACGNVVPGVRSIYRWEGRIQDESEALVVLKTTRVRIPELVARIRTLHPYEVPEVLALPVEEGNGAYLEWVVKSTS
jgi:periplasmic divalent cation tolerance protein